MYAKTLKIRGANFKLKTDAGESAVDLIPKADISDVLEAKARDLLRKRRCTCDFTMTFRILPIHYKRSRWTFFVFLTLLIAIEYAHLTIVAPCKYLILTHFDSLIVRHHSLAVFFV